MPPLRTLPVALAALLLAGSALAAPPFGPCPANEMAFDGGVPFTRTSAVFDTSDGSNHVAYDLVAGTVFMHQCCFLLTTFVDAFDDYDLVGVAPGTPVPLTVTLTIDGYVKSEGCGGSGCAGMYAVRVRHGATADSIVHSTQTFTQVNFHDVLTLPVTIVAGTPERIDYQAWGHRNPGGFHSSEANVLVTFAGVPPGAFVVSCQGYGGIVTPTRAATWGRVKVLYR